ncbi:MAG: transposase [Elusimicrobia bacterium]|nr:transposase [Elusimicrobiota bacterium]
MGRPNRIQFPGACYYIRLGGNNRQSIFLSNQDRRAFLQLLRAYKERFGLKVYAYCLMESSVDLVLETSQPNLSKVMQGFNTAYTKHFNLEHGAIGHVFQGRYKALLVDKEKCLLDLTGYVHLTPVREGLREKPWRYLWSSCAAFVEAEEREPLVDSEAVLVRLAKNRLKQSVLYLKFIKERAKQGGISLPSHASLFIGDLEFAESVRKTVGDLPPAADAPVAAAAAKAILADVLQRHRVDEERLLGRGQWRKLTAIRREAIYRIWREAKVGVTELARMFNRTPSAISQLIRAADEKAYKINK